MLSNALDRECPDSFASGVQVVVLLFRGRRRMVFFPDDDSPKGVIRHAKVGITKLKRDDHDGVTRITPSLGTVPRVPQVKGRDQCVLSLPELQSRRSSSR